MNSTLIVVLRTYAYLTYHSFFLNRKCMGKINTNKYIRQMF